nr:hypothetical protein B0A51_13270 [Rachicladosporium sp. CCFEE 5018]
MPTRQQRQDDSGPATQAFLKWIEGPHAVPESPDLQDFVPSGAVFEYLNHDNRLASILTETFSSSDDRPSAHVILEKHCQVFAILVAIGSAELIRECIPFPALKDEKLPFTNRPTNFPHDTRDGGFGRRRAKDNLFARFQRWQPHFCAPKIEQQHGYRLDSDSILPYVEKDDIGRGASSIVYKVAIHSRHDGLKAANGVPSTHADHRQYALKVYQGPDSQRNCQDEVKAFRALGQTGLEATGIIGHYGSYVYKDQYHLVLEHADLGDLERIVARESPPSVDDEIVAFWESIFAIVSAVVRIHDLQDGVHQDIKMSNVLVKSRRNSRTLYEAAFGLTDLGTMRHRDHTTGDRTIDNHGVKAYGAPECHRDDTFDDSRRFANTAAADIFSLGCLLSELSVWVVFGVKGPHGLQGYREERIAGHGDEVRGQDSFHCRGENGRELLPAVTAAHDKLLRAGKCDSTTKAIVELLPELLAIEPEDRPSAKSLRHRLNLLIKKAKSKLSEAHPRTSVQTPPNWRPESDAVSTPASPTPDRQSARSFVNRPKAVSLATPGIHSDGYGFHADHTDLATMVDSPRAMTLMETRIQPHSRATEHLLDSVSASLDLGNQHPDDAAVFVMDNSKSMYEIHAEDKRLGRKPNHLELVRLLGWLTKSMDPNGVDLHYFSAAKKYQTEPLTNCKKSTDMENSLRAAKCTNTTTPNLEVGRLLVDYRQRLADYRQSARGSLRRIAAKVTGLPRPLSLYILTDGVWETPSHKGGGYLETEIKMLVQELIAAGLPRQQVGIQFIRFGSHEFGKQRLDHLDHLKKALKLGCDIVDTEPVEGGNIWKMLLGAINENFDDDDNEDDDDDHGHQALHGPAVSTIPVSGS